MSTAGKREKALVIYDTVFGNTQKIGDALARGMRRYCDVDFLSIDETDLAKISQYGLVAIGAPTQAFTAHKPMKEFLSRLEKSKELGGKFGFAFDTRIDSRLSGSAAKYIQERLERLKVKMVRPRESAIVSGGTKDNVLRPGEEARFERIGAEIGAILSKPKMVVGS